MSLITLLLIVWAVLTTILVILLFYRSTLTMRENDQFFLDDSESHIEKEQKEILAKVHKLSPFVNLLGATSGILILIIAGLWVYKGLSTL